LRKNVISDVNGIFFIKNLYRWFLTIKQTFCEKKNLFGCEVIFLLKKKGFLEKQNFHDSWQRHGIS
jgi:hypothetical protein